MASVRRSRIESLRPVFFDGLTAGSSPHHTTVLSPCLIFFILCLLFIACFSFCIRRPIFFSTHFWFPFPSFSRQGRDQSLGCLSYAFGALQKKGEIVTQHAVCMSYYPVPIRENWRVCPA